MLTDDDLKKIDGLLESKFDLKLAPVGRDITSIKEDVSKIRKDIDAMLSFFDREYLNLRSRVERIEEKLGITHLEENS